MTMIPSSSSKLQVDVDGGTSNGDDTIEGVVLAADGLGRAGISSDSNNTDWGTAKANNGSNVLNHDAQKRDYLGSGSAVSRGDAVAALEVTSVALAGRLVATSWSGGRKAGNGESGKDRKLELHVDRRA